MINNTIQAVTGAYTKNTTTAVKPVTKAAPAASVEKDEIVLSTEAQNFSTTLQQLKDMAGNVRTDKVDYYENQIAAGNYSVSASDVAGRLLQMRY